MGTTFFGFAMSDSMFQGDCALERRVLSPAQAGEIIKAGVEPCLNPSHAATIAAMRGKFGIEVGIPDTPPRVSLGGGDRLLVLGVRGLPRLTDRHEYTEEEVASATFSFALWEVVG